MADLEAQRRKNLEKVPSWFTDWLRSFNAWGTQPMTKTWDLPAFNAWGMSPLGTRPATPSTSPKIQPTDITTAYTKSINNMPAGTVRGKYGEWRDVMVNPDTSAVTKNMGTVYDPKFGNVSAIEYDKYQTDLQAYNKATTQVGRNTTGEPTDLQYDATKGMFFSPSTGEYWTSSEGTWFMVTPESAAKKGAKSSSSVEQWDSAMAKNQEAVAVWNAKNANQNTDLQRRANELEFENRRQQILGTLDPQNQWVSFYRTYSAPNPYQAQPETPGQYLESSQKAFNEAEQNWWNADTPEQRANARAMATNFNESIQQAQRDVTTQGAEGNRGNTTPNANPNTPNWLPQFVPGQVVGQPIKNLPVTPTSGQQWANTPISQQKGLQDYMKWMGGQSYEDYLSNLEMSLPNTKGGGSRWQPARQRRV